MMVWFICLRKKLDIDLGPLVQFVQDEKIKRGATSMVYPIVMYLIILMLFFLLICLVVNRNLSHKPDDKKDDDDDFIGWD